MPHKRKLTSKDCLTCGLCCCPPDRVGRSFANVTDKDEKRMGVKLTKKLVVDPDIWELMMEGLSGRPSPRAIKTEKVKNKEGPLKGDSILRCAALKGNLCSGVRCSIYEVRPAVCRTAVKPGDLVCQRIRSLLQKS
jgi:Fe-S-cluster containining protein